MLGLPLLVCRRRPLLAVLGVTVVGGAVGALAPVADSAAALLPLSLAAYAIGAHARGRRRWVATLVVVAVVVLVPLAVGGSGGPDLLSLVPPVATLVCLHAEAARLPGAGLEQRRASMVAVGGAAHAATAELREGLAALDDGSPADEIAAVAAGLGLTPRVTLDGTVDAHEAVLVRRVVRECLVNAARHAAGAQVDVRIRTTDDRVTVVIATAPAGAARTEPYAAGSGRGLSGLAALLAGSGGRLEHGPTPDGGFRVQADLPSRAGRSADAIR